MKKAIKKIACLLLSALTVTSGLTMTACKEQVYDTETRPVVFSTDALDGNFNPFFATSATDSTIAAMTQVGMLTTDAAGNVAYGKEYPTVVLDYKKTMYDGETKEATEDAAKAAKENGGWTEYEFIIKNGMKFSDGEPLTIKDVLFNLYVYLDPYYMGSATIYSTDIRGLKAYRAQDPTLADDDDLNLDNKFYGDADVRINNLLDYLDDETEATPQIEADIVKIKALFAEEAESDWSMVAGTQESYKEEYTFTEDWQIYYFNEGIVSIQRNPATKKPERDENGKYVTSLDLEDNELTKEIEAVKNGENTEKTEYTLEYWMEKEGCTREEAAEYAVKRYAIDQVIRTNTETTKDKLADVIRYWATGSNARDEFAAEARSNYFANLTTSVSSVSGITTYKTSAKFNGDNLGEEHDVLKIAINGVDPKAVWNFAFSVAPMHYYSNADAIANTPYGVKFSDKEFFDTVLQDPAKNGKPVGAGVYMASNEQGDQTNVTKDNFYRNNWVYFERNTNFYTMLGDGTNTENNAKIKYLRYRVVGSDKIMQALQAGNIDFGSPQATTTNIAEVDKYGDKLAYSKYPTNGYGYVGINPKFVPDIEVRQAIMKAMDTASIVKNYYTTALAEVIYRPMSKESWAYPKGATEFYEYTTDKAVIQELVESADWTLGSDGIYEKDGEKLKITFTIAGESTDHPAYEMFQDAANFLNECGFDVSVTTDITALKKLATGGLAVWAAAWNSTIDPDMYQVYHKDSKATSIKNWGYSTIFADTTTGQFTDEQNIINDLSDLIEQGRATLDEDARTDIYAQALDKVMELAVELPTYQRNDLVVYNKTVIDASTLNSNPTANAGVYDELWKVNYL